MEQKFTVEGFTEVRSGYSKDNIFSPNETYFETVAFLPNKKKKNKVRQWSVLLIRTIQLQLKNSFQ